MSTSFHIRSATPSEFEAAGQLMIGVYSQLQGFPCPGEQPAFYHMLAHVGTLTRNEGTEIMIAETGAGKLAGAVVYFNDMQFYGSGGLATLEKNAAGFRLLAVAMPFMGKGIGKALTNACIRKAKENNRLQLIIHSTKAMTTAWAMYERMGFQRSPDLDFAQGDLPVYGFRLYL